MIKQLFCLLFFTTMCTNHPKLPNKVQTLSLLKSENKDSLIIGAYYAGESKDKSYINALLNIAFDPRISHNKDFYGISVSQSALIALEKITGVAPPNKNAYKVDSVNIDFFIKNNQLYQDKAD